jgi:predicted nucleotide-binding protein (sugar kinase/HSP70/actin superfamily)
MKITFAYWGNYTIAIKALFEKLGLDIIPPEKTSPETIREGVRLSPEMYCFPLKVNMGNYLAAIKKGADTILMVTSLSGSCRLRYYGVIQDKSLSEGGYKVDFIIFDQGLKDIYSKLKKLSGASFWQILKAIRFSLSELSLIEKLEKKAQYLRPREKIKGKTDEALREIFSGLEKIKNLRELAKFKKEIKKKISKIEINKKKDIPKVALIGEIYTVSDSAINFGIEEKLGREKIEVHREMDLTYHLKKGIFPWKEWEIQRGIRPYLKSTVGGHGRDAIFEMLNYIKNNFDGIIHLLPFGCMPETTVRPILEKIHQESGIPFLSLSLDEQVAEAGIDTRIEAFVDVVRNYYNHKKS